MKIDKNMKGSDGMCITCNYKNFVVCENDSKKLENQCGNGNLYIRCDLNGNNYKLVVKEDNKSEFVIYRCPTCGRKLFK